MTDLVDEFYQKRQVLASVRFADATTRISGFLTWMETKDRIKAIIDTVQASVDIDRIIAECGGNNPPAASTPEEITAVGLLLMEKCQEGKDLFQLLHGYGIRPYSNSAQDYIDEAMDRFIEPALDFIEDGLRDLDEETTVESAMEYHLSSIIFSILFEFYPNTADRLQTIAKMFTSYDYDGQWFNVGNSCREVLKAFTKELSELGKIEVTEELKSGDVKGIMKHSLGKATGSGRFEDTLANLVAATWDHSQTITHRPNTTKKDAFRVFIWTALAISEIATEFD